MKFDSESQVLLFIFVYVISVVSFEFGSRNKKSIILSFNPEILIIICLVLLPFIWLHDLVNVTSYSDAGELRLNADNNYGIKRVLKDWVYLVSFSAVQNNRKRFNLFSSLILVIIWLYPIALMGQRKMLAMLFFAVFLNNYDGKKITFSRGLLLGVTIIFGVSIFQLFTHMRGTDDPLLNLGMAFDERDNFFQFLLFSGGEFVMPFSTLGIFLKDYQNYQMMDGWVIPVLSYIPNFFSIEKFRGLAEYFTYINFPDLAEHGKGYAFSAIGAAFWRWGFIGLLVEFYLLGLFLKILVFSARVSNNRSVSFLIYASIFNLGVETIRGDLLLVPKIFFMTFLFLIFNMKLNVRA